MEKSLKVIEAARIFNLHEPVFWGPCLFYAPHLLLHYPEVIEYYFSKIILSFHSPNVFFLPVKIALGVDKSGAKSDCKVRPSVLSGEHCS